MLSARRMINKLFTVRRKKWKNLGTSHKPKIPDDWWPSALSDFSTEKPLDNDHIVVAEISEPWGTKSHKHLYTALVPNDEFDALMNHRGCIGHDVTTPGPWPSEYRGKFNYEPRFYIDGLDVCERLEPLVVSWDSAGKTMLLPDQGFLMTYGLVPRNCEPDELCWDDPDNRVFDVVKVEPPSEYHYRLLRGSRVLVRREYLQDYATVRDMNIIQTYYVENSTNNPDPLSEQLVKDHVGDIHVPRRMIGVRLDSNAKDRISARVWGYRHLIEPGEAPVSIDVDYGVLDWPGHGVVDGSTGMDWSQLPMVGICAYVRDSVLGEYEGSPGFEIHPENGMVSYGGQWSVAHTQRIGRDLIQVELKKLYETNRPKTVKTWHRYCADPPAKDTLPALWNEPNIATRAKSVVYAMVELGEVLAEISTEATGAQFTGHDLVKLDRAELDYSGWWNDDVTEPISRHAQLDMSEGDFLARCVDLFKIVGEGLSEKILRRTLAELGIKKNEIKSLGSLKLLERITQLAKVAEKTGLELIAQCAEIEARRKDDCPHTPVNVLLHLRALRNCKSHRDADAGQALKDLGVNHRKMVPGWGSAVDLVYDRIAEAIQTITHNLKSGAAIV